VSVTIQLAYLLAAFLFALGLKLMSSPETARWGNMASACAMLLTVVVTLLHTEVVEYQWILVGVLIGSAIGSVAATRLQLTEMPELVALFNGFGGGASLLVGWEAYHRDLLQEPLGAVTILLAVVIGGVTFSGSLVAWGKLKEIGWRSFRLSRPLLFSGQQPINFLLLALLFLGGVLYVLDSPESQTLFLVLMALAFLLGIMVVVPIGGADMPVVISLLNSYSGLAACAAGFVIFNNILIVAGALVGASGLILTSIMCKAMNRSLTNVLFSGFGAVVRKSLEGTGGDPRPISAEDAYFILEAARSVVFVPGYGLAVAQAQHGVMELGELLEDNGCEVRYAVHPVAGRMPGHMNVLLAEANVSYDLLVEIDDVNPTMETVDVCVVIGANDVVNPAARDDPESAIYGMPIIEVDRARVVIVLKRSMATGFAGIENPLFYKDNTRMLFGDAKSSLNAVLGEFKRS